MRVSVSDLESFRRFRTDEDFPLSALLRQLRREDPPSLKMRAGTALHALLETADGQTFDSAEMDGFRFDFVCDADLELATFREISGVKTYRAGGEEVTLSARVDALYGKAIEDHKLTEAFDAERYADSVQWRAYLSIFDADAFTYNVFVGSVSESLTEGEPHAVEVRDFHRITFYRYPELEQDVRREVERFAEFAHRHLTVAA